MNNCTYMQKHTHQCVQKYLVQSLIILIAVGYVYCVYKFSEGLLHDLLDQMTLLHDR